MRLNNRFLAALATAALSLIFGAGTALADTVNYTLTAGNTALSPTYTGPYALATVTTAGPNSATATITFTSAVIAGRIYLLGDGTSAGVNTNGAATISGISGTHLPGFVTDSYTPVNSVQNIGDSGSFSNAIDSSNGFTDSSTSISFTLTKASGTWASAGDVLLANALGNAVSAHIFVCALTCTTASGALVTGFAAGDKNPDSPPDVFVPIPAAAWLFGSGLIGLIGIARRRRPA